MNIRCFDLGGSGLKTCVYRDGDIALESFQRFAPAEHEDIARWIRVQLPGLDEEIRTGFKFSFSLAGLGKLSKSGRLCRVERKSDPVSKLFGMPSDSVLCQNDGDAHLLASRIQLGVNTLPHVNFSIGTGIGVGMYDAKGELLAERTLTKKLGKDVWNFVTDSQASRKESWFALADQGYEELLRNDPQNALRRFQNRWIKFLANQFFVALREVPKSLTFTGGVVDSTNLFAFPSQLEDCQILRGPANGGLLGAKLYAERE